MAITQDTGMHQLNQPIHGSSSAVTTSSHPPPPPPTPPTTTSSPPGLELSHTLETVLGAITDGQW